MAGYLELDDRQSWILCDNCMVSVASQMNKIVNTQMAELWFRDSVMLDDMKKF